MTLAWWRTDAAKWLAIGFFLRGLMERVWEWAAR